MIAIGRHARLNCRFYVSHLDAHDRTNYAEIASYRFKSKFPVFEKKLEITIRFEILCTFIYKLYVCCVCEARGSRLSYENR